MVGKFSLPQAGYVQVLFPVDELVWIKGAGHFPVDDRIGIPVCGQTFFIMNINNVFADGRSKAHGNRIVIEIKGDLPQSSAQPNALRRGGWPGPHAAGKGSYPVPPTTPWQP